MSQKTKSLKRLRGLDPADLEKEEQDLRMAIWKIQLQRAGGHQADPNRMKETRKDLARVLTLRGERAAAARAGGK